MEGGGEGGHYSEQLERVLRVRGVTLLGLLYAPAGVHAEWGSGQNRVRESWSRQLKCILYILIFFLLLLPLLLLNLLRELALELLRQHEKLFT